MEDIILVGFGGHGKSVADCIEREKLFRIAGYTDNKEQSCGYPYLGTDQELFNCFEKGIKNAAVCVVLASEGYPVSYEKGFPIGGLEKFEGKDGYYCFHAGTKEDGQQIVTNGGRVLGVTATGRDLHEARENAYQAAEWVTFENKYMRHDIGKAIDEV